MRERRLGSSAIDVGEIGLGCMPMNWAYVGDASDTESIAVIHRALDLGVTLLDTSDVYGPFTNEELVGRALDGHRDRAVVATKAGLVVGPSGGYPLDNDARPEHIREAVEASLRRLRLDVIDLYQLHLIEPHEPLDPSQRGFLFGSLGDGHAVPGDPGDDLVERAVVVELPAERGGVLCRSALQQEPAFVVVQAESHDIGQRLVDVHADGVAAEPSPVGELLGLDDDVPEVDVAEDVSHGRASSRGSGTR